MLKRLIALIIVIGLVGAGVFVWRGRAATAETSSSTLISALSGEADARFARATIPNNIEFPRDLGAHDDYQTEWWYYTGNLQSADDPDREFGFQFTIFRRAMEPPTAEQDTSDADSSFRTNQIYFAHFTVSDVANDTFRFSERFSREGAGLAGAQASPYRVWIEDWGVQEQADGTVLLSADAGDYALNLVLEQTMAPVLHGEGGLSAKSLEAGNASYYYSLVQQRATGSVRVGDETVAVTGKAWKDHEYSTSVLSDGALGWDWFSLQFDDGSALMLFEIRKAGGEVEPASSGTFVMPSGETVDLALGDWELIVDKVWTSPITGGDYPNAWQLTIPKVDLSISGGAKMENQELQLPTGSYWEGAVGFSGSRDGVQVSANGYVEMTGYSK